MIVFDNKDHGRLIAAAIPRPFNPEADTVISNVNSSGLLGGVIYEGYTTNNIFMHQAAVSKHWLFGDMLWVAFDYPFNQLGVAKVCGTIPSYDTKLLEFNRRLGFKEECRIKDAYPGGDLIVLSMTREECRWLKLKPRTIKRNTGVRSNE